LDFISRCLRWDPDRRLKPDEAMHHEFVTGMKRPAGASSGRTRAVQGTGPTSAPSPIKRLNTVQTPQRKTTEGSRPLPEPPMTSFRHASAAPPLSASPIKGGPGRRHSTFTAGQTGAAGVGGVKRGSNGTNAGGAGGSNLPRAAQGTGRSVSGKPDLASAAAAASLVG
jgi:dual specificity tyrosine-phosphorylation-regulated kinase 2/3/4